MTSDLGNRSGRLRVAYGAIPKEGGTFSFYRNHRSEFEQLGVDVRCVAIGREALPLWRDEFADEKCLHLAPRETSLTRQVRAFVDWCDRERIDVVIPVNSRPILASIPHLPERVRVIARSANALHQEYLFASTSLDRVSSVVALTPRLRDDLVERYGVDRSQIRLIPNGVDVGLFRSVPRTPLEGKQIRLAFIGRLEHQQKGVLHLPPILSSLEELEVDFHLTVVGTGVHEPELRAELRRLGLEARVSFRGVLRRDGVAAVLGENDAYIFPSHFEGCPNALLEAMAAGCVPISWCVPGITDFLIEEGRTGYLHPIGDTAAMATTIARLASGELPLLEVSQRTQQAATANHSLSACAQQYLAAMEAALNSAPASTEPRPLSQFAPPAYLLRRWPWLPESIRSALRSMRRHIRAKGGRGSGA